ncbi:unnamed protein product [Gongylonema pulchrum]|uniref:Integrase catalytic domain-containing protein n=1 Tax=Gongylonema pulchrum TaxID=637853 RepID=A0A183EBM3_9BILA|nr:unnamed protein product [Gongylonema pulchrum]
MRLFERSSPVVVVPQGRRKQLVLEAHADTSVTGGLGCTDILKWVRECQQCAILNTHPKHVPPLRPITTSKPYEIVGIDHVPPLRPITTFKPYEIVGIDVLKLGLTRAGNRYLLVVIDHFTKWCSAYSIPDKKADTIAKVFADAWCAREGRTPLVFLPPQFTAREARRQPLLELAVHSCGDKQPTAVTIAAVLPAGNTSLNLLPVRT